MSRPRILAIDDTPQNLLTLGAALATEFELQVATSGSMGIALAKDSPPDLILLDVMMPEMDGFETCRRLKSEPCLQRVPVIFVTALTDPDAETAGFALGAADYITKPINVEIARQRIRNLLEREQLRKEVEAQRNQLQVRLAERELAEAALRKNQESLKEAQRIARIGNWELDLLRNTLTWSDEIFRIFEIERTGFGASYEAFLAAIHPGDREAVNFAYRHSLEARVPYAIFHRLLMPDGRIKYVHEQCESIFDSEGKALRSIGTVQDVTEHKSAEAAKERLEAQLRESQKMEALGTLAGGVAHDFNNALATIIGNVELARQDVGPGHPALVSLDEIGKASRRAKDLVQQILSFGRRQALERKATSLALVVVETARLVRATLPVKLSLKVNCAADTPAVLADGAQIKQILLNLCGNALAALQDQGREGVIEIGLSAYTHKEGQTRANLRPGRYACLAVLDNGSGMDETTRSHIFEPFFTTKAVGKGTGLGLAVVHGIVQAHEASIEVESASGEGSAFRIYFPAIDAPVEEFAPPAAGAAQVHGAGKRVLYVDDEEAIVFLMKRLLERQGFRVSGYTDPREALAAVRANPDQFDLVVTDYNMPGMCGLTVATSIRDLRPDLPVVLASGFITEDLRQKAPAAGIRELIYKPNTVDDLCEAVARYANAHSKSKCHP